MNRFILTTLTVLFFSGLASAQFSKGNLLVGGELSYSESSNQLNGTTNQNVHSGVFNVSLGKAMNENAIIGINLTYSGAKENIPYLTKGNIYGIGIFYRKYKSLGKDFYLFGEAGAGYAYSNNKGTDTAGAWKVFGTTNSGRIYFTPGIAYQASKRLFIEITIPAILSAQYTIFNGNIDPAQENSKASSFNISTSLNSSPLSNLGIGFRLIL
jgi:hypothetical protein